MASGAPCIVLFPELDVSSSGPPQPTPAGGMQAASRSMLTAAVMQPSLHKGVFSPAHWLTHVAGKILPEFQRTRSAGWTWTAATAVWLLTSTVVNRITNHN